MVLTYREAGEEDLEPLVAMLSDDALGAEREDTSRPLNPGYIRAFEQIRRDPNHELIVVEHSGQPVGMLQLTFIPYLTHIGSWRCQIEGVRIRSDYRGQGLGKRMLVWAIARAGERGCALVQLTSDKQRVDALRFYEQVGFEATHEGFKLRL